jgi:hypothetical protein
LCGRQCVWNWWLAARGVGLVSRPCRLYVRPFAHGGPCGAQEERKKRKTYEREKRRSDPLGNLTAGFSALERLAAADGDDGEDGGEDDGGMAAFKAKGRGRQAAGRGAAFGSDDEGAGGRGGAGPWRGGGVGGGDKKRSRDGGRGGGGGGGGSRGRKKFRGKGR